MQEFARSIVDTVRHPLLVLDARLRVVVANAAFDRTFESESSTIVGHDFFEIGEGRWNQPRLRKLLNEVIPQNGSFRDFEVGYECPHRGPRVMVLDAHRVARDEDGVPMVLLAIEDQSERRDELRQLNSELERLAVGRAAELETANQALTAANRELAATNRELEAFCYSVSHDLRSPLRAVDGFSQELLHNYADKIDDLGRHYLTRVRAGTQRMGRLIDDLLKLSRVTRTEMQSVQVDMTAIAEGLIAEQREREPGRQVTFTAQPGLIAQCDSGLVNVVLGNLLGNAWKFTANKPTGTISFERTEVAGRPAFVVRDDGAGFDMAFAGKLFGVFQRLHPDREFPGTGIGLATVQRIIRRHGGEVWAEGAVGRGAAFFFTLPGREAHP